MVKRSYYRVPGVLRDCCPDLRIRFWYLGRESRLRLLDICSDALQIGYKRLLRNYPSSYVLASKIGVVDYTLLCLKKLSLAFRPRSARFV
jgi:hypothetical protein